MEFCFSQDQRSQLADMLSRARPRLPRDRIEFFLNDVENSITHTLKSYPAGWKPDHEAPKRLKSVSNAAYELQAALRCLGDSALFAICADLIHSHHRVRPNGRSGKYQDQIRAEWHYIEGDLMALKSAADHLLNNGTHTKHSLAEDIARNIACAYVDAFNTLPSLRNGSVYRAVVAELAENCLPELHRVTIGRDRLQRANACAKARYLEFSY